MAKIIQLRRHQAISVKAKSKHRVRLRVTDGAYPEETRWDVQRPIQNAGSFRALNGFDDRCARSGRWHAFEVSHRLISRFARQIEPYAARNQVEVRIDGQAVRMVKKVRA
ncbi:hypothetical protein [Mesorhizobium helmanticense]|uniref:Uncharacterized protein n=1 Tax=Mesorhizobium helmanticense TaxID=1776423 RepID=A0A2T4IVS2_9HYPH|nr:hypothetical protein [Mesorhizobium helmanticense]PTE09715.1 hypothetical protein C9427_13540 [Mesorhizobium helmanticense]